MDDGSAVSPAATRSALEELDDFVSARGGEGALEPASGATEAATDPSPATGGSDAAAGTARKGRDVADDPVAEHPAIRPHRKAALARKFELPLVLAGAFVPTMVLWLLAGRSFAGSGVPGTAAAVALAIFASWYVLSRLKIHANARHLSYVIPVNFVAFSCALAAMALLRIPYSGNFFAVGATCAVLISFLAAVYGRRLVRLHVVVGGGRAAEIQLSGHFVPAPSLADLEKLVNSGWRDWTIVADLHYPHSDRCERLFAKAALAGIPVYHFRQIAEMQSGQVKITHLSENDLGSLIPNVSYASAKRILDILGALLLLPLCLPVFMVLAILIRLDSPGSAFFIQQRMGFRGETFRMVKFRTMRERTVAEEELAKREDAVTKSDDDRITRLGKFLRRTRMDELPQILNVLIGDMSFIGPRPEACALSEWYEAELPFYSYRHILRPGITGWAQVNQGHVTDVSDVLSKLRYDFYYIKNISLWLDILIALKTLRVIVTGLGAK
jgi:lipopolysaccharide/colanic/teichoic acid biosynthesis glycosyltransferase